MERYDYYSAVKADVAASIREQYTMAEVAVLLQDRDAFHEQLFEEMWLDDSVTGNASGSYTFNAYTAEEYLCHNLDLLAEAAREFGSDIELLKDGAEFCDVTIRCYLLGMAICDVLDEIEAELGESEAVQQAH
jgi:hypothetical protein